MEKPEQKIEQEPKPRDISADYSRIMAGENKSRLWSEFILTLEGEKQLLLIVDLSKIKDKKEFRRQAISVKSFRMGETGAQRRIAVVRATAQQRYGSDPTGGTTYGWADDILNSGIRWEEVE
ncbi:MAG: hypothetical protein PHS62_02485 [Patescibacteria group bacterium]|nr:hypothetical protein [Patescibacteria group bacterium]